MMKNYAREYGEAMYELAHAKGVEEKVFNDFGEVVKVISSSPDYLRLLSNPRLSSSERADAVGKVFGGKIDGYLLNMLKIFAEKRMCSLIPKCYGEYKNIYCRANNILAVTATSAVALSEEQKARLVQKLSAKTGSRILLTCITDPACIGGIRLEYAGKRVDASVRQRLTSLRRSIMDA